MPVFEMPPEELRTYQGINPKPEDFDEYWRRALEALGRTEEDLELVPSGFQSAVAECFDLFFTGVGGARIHAKYLRPRSAKTPHPALLLFHGYTGNSGDWTITRTNCCSARSFSTRLSLPESSWDSRRWTRPGSVRTAAPRVVP